ncbi:MAG: nicotinamide riboside transporter PnuC [Bacteroidales bacterium]|nr:nicotinamide riboside transporter PnuC [Bacteroidales bacterium]
MLSFLQSYISEFNFFRLCELIGTVSGFLVLYFQVKQKPVMWNFNVISATFLGINFFANEIYAYAFFQIYYVVASIYGLYVWLHGQEDSGKELPIKRLSKMRWGAVVGVFVLLYAVLYGIIKRTGSELVGFDTFVTTASSIATFLLAKKFFEQWYFWLLSDIVYVSAIIYYEQSGLYITFTLYSCYIISAFIGIFAWKRQIEAQNKL